MTTRQMVRCGFFSDSRVPESGEALNPASRAKLFEPKMTMIVQQGKVDSERNGGRPETSRIS